jgi:hypothetical protein
MLDPLGQSQVIPYLKELSRAGVRFTLLSFEGPQAYTSAGIQRSASEDFIDVRRGGVECYARLYEKVFNLPN